MNTVKFAKVFVTLLLLVSTIAGAFAAPSVVPTPVRDTHMLYDYIPAVRIDTLTPRYNAVLAELSSLSEELLSLRKEILTIIADGQENTQRLEEINARLDYIAKIIKGKILPGIERLKLPIRIGPFDVPSPISQEQIGTVELLADRIYSQIEEEWLRIVTYTQLLEAKKNVDGRLARLSAQYEEAKDRLNDAFDDRDTSDIDKYKEELQVISDNLDALIERIDIALDTARELHTPTAITTQLEQLKADILAIQEDIADLLGKELSRRTGGDGRSKSSRSSPTIIDTPSLELPSGKPSVEVKIVDSFPVQETAVLTDNWQEMRTMIWLIAGNIILLAVIVFFIMLLI